MVTEKVISDITAVLKSGGAEKIILFGSYAYGKPDNNSDLDLIVISPEENIPETNREKMELHHRYNLLINKYRGLIPIDLIVYTRAMFCKIQESGNQFIREINQKGKILYETINQGMA